MQNKPLTLPQAIARQEGFGKPNTRATRNHNPGNLNFGEVARMWGSLKSDDKGYAIFQSDADGWKALTYLLRTKQYRGLTLTKAIAKYAPPVGDVRGKNDVNAYVKNVCEWCGMKPDSVIDDYISA